MSSDLNRQTFKTNYRPYMENIRTQKKWNSDISVFSNQATHVTVTVVLLCIYQNSLSHTDIHISAWLGKHHLYKVSVISLMN